MFSAVFFYKAFKQQQNKTKQGHKEMCFIYGHISILVSVIILWSWQRYMFTVEGVAAKDVSVRPRAEQTVVALV